jgi:protein TonB
MPSTETQAGTGTSNGVKAAPKKPPEPRYQLTFIEPPGIVASLREGLREFFSGPKISVSSKYYRGQVRLPVTEMAPWWRDFPTQIKSLFEAPRDPIGIFNRGQAKKRALCGMAGALVLGAVGAYFRRPSYIFLGILLGYALGEIAGGLRFKKRAYPPEIWRDYLPESGSWVNSLLVHMVIITSLILPYYIHELLQGPKTTTAAQIPPPVTLILPAAPKQMGGGGGGGARELTAPSKGRIPQFSKVQLAPPMVKVPILHPKISVPPTLLGPPKLKLPQMNITAQLGDPMGVPGPPSAGPGTGGGIGTGSGSGVGEGNGGGFGKGSGAGYGGGAFSVGGGVSAPIPIYQPEPPYSEEARKAKYQGTLVMWIVVDALGRVTQEQVVKPLGMGLDAEALKTVKTWKFIPAKRNGSPVPVQVDVEVTFRLF